MEWHVLAQLSEASRGSMGAGIGGSSSATPSHLGSRFSLGLGGMGERVGNPDAKSESVDPSRLDGTLLDEKRGILD